MYTHTQTHTQIHTHTHTHSISEKIRRYKNVREWEGMAIG